MAEPSNASAGESNTNHQIVDLTLASSAEEQLFVAAGDGNVELLKQVLADNPAIDLEYKDEYNDDELAHDNCTSLFMASSKGFTEVVRELIRAGADVEGTDSFENTCLMFAVYKGHAAIAKLLIEGGSDVNVLDWDARTCLMDTARHGYLTIADELLRAGCDVNLEDCEGATALDIARKNGQMGVAKAIEREIFRRKRQPAYRVRACLVQLRGKGVDAFVKQHQQGHQLDYQTHQGRHDCHHHHHHHDGEECDCLLLQQHEHHHHQQYHHNNQQQQQLLHQEGHPQYQYNGSEEEERIPLLDEIDMDFRVNGLMWGGEDDDGKLMLTDDGGATDDEDYSASSLDSLAESMYEYGCDEDGVDESIAGSKKGGTSSSCSSRRSSSGGGSSTGSVSGGGDSLEEEEYDSLSSSVYGDDLTSDSDGCILGEDLYGLGKRSSKRSRLMSCEEGSTSSMTHTHTQSTPARKQHHHQQQQEQQSLIQAHTIPPD